MGMEKVNLPGKYVWKNIFMYYYLKKEKKLHSVASMFSFLRHLSHRLSDWDLF